MERKSKAYRFTQEMIDELEELTRVLGTSETEALYRAVHFYLTFLKNEEDFVKQKSVVSIQEYVNMQEKLQSQLSQVLYRVGTLEGENKEKDRLIESLQETIKNQQATIQKLLDKKSWWRFWR